MKARYAAMGIVGLCAMQANGQHFDWGVQLGTPLEDITWAVAPDGSGGVIIGGVTHGALGEVDPGGEDAFIARFDPESNLMWVTQFGSDGDETINRMCSDGEGGVYMTGWTTSNLGGDYQGGEHDAWVGRFDADGNEDWIAQIGTSAEDWGWGVAPDGEGGVFVTGFTYGMLGEESFGDRDGFLARYDAEGNQSWIKQFGSDAEDYPFGAASDGAGGVFVAGHTWGDLVKLNEGTGDAFVLRFDADGVQIDAVQFGSANFEQIKHIAPDGEGGVVVCGPTFGDLAAENAGGNDWFAGRFDDGLNELWLHQIGTSAGEQPQAVTSDGQGGALVAGGSQGDLGGVPNAGGPDTVIARFDTDGLVWATQLGTSGSEIALGIAPDGVGGFYVGGHTEGDLMGENQGDRDGWVARYGCSADMNDDGDLNILDFVAFQNLWQANDASADCNDDGAFNILDFVCYQNLFQAGCP